jgi:hypothetical protein
MASSSDRKWTALSIRKYTPEIIWLTPRSHGTTHTDTETAPYLLPSCQLSSRPLHPRLNLLNDARP